MNNSEDYKKTGAINADSTEYPHASPSYKSTASSYEPQASVSTRETEANRARQDKPWQDYLEANKGPEANFRGSHR